MGRTAAQMLTYYLPCGGIYSRASDYGLVKIDSTGRIVQFAEKPKGADLRAMVRILHISFLDPHNVLFPFPY